MAVRNAWKKSLVHADRSAAESHEIWHRSTSKASTGGHGILALGHIFHQHVTLRIDIIAVKV